MLYLCLTLLTERMHHLNGPGGNKIKKPAPRRQSRAKAKDPMAIKGPPNVALEPVATPSKVVYQIAFCINIYLLLFFSNLEHS